MDDAARLAVLARRAADEVRSGMTLGLGSGSTAEAVVRELGARVGDGLTIRGVATSERTAALARTLGIPLVGLDEVAATGRPLDLGIDGADEVDPELNLTKGRGGALLHEKLVALACARFVVVVAEEKLVERLGTRTPLPVEVVPLGWRTTALRVAALGVEPVLRVVAGGADDGGPFRSDGGHLILDCATGGTDDPASLASALKATTGVVDHGLFVGMADRVLAVDASGLVRALDR
jgi:ribose 5-phosphate isomerase A